VAGRPLPAAVAALAVALAGCGSDAATPAKVPPNEVTIYSSAPVSGLLGPKARDTVRAERLALAEDHGRAGRLHVRFVSLDSTVADTGRWGPEVVLANAKRAAEDATAVAYLGEFDSGASAVSVPYLNPQGLLTVSPGDTLAGLTRPGVATRGEPDKYYPTHRFTFARTVPDDDVQATAMLDWMRAAGVRSVYLLDDQTGYGRGFATRLERLATLAGLTVVDHRGIDRTRADPLKLAADLTDAERRHGADAVLYAGVLAPEVAPILDALVAANPGVELYVPGALAVTRFVARLAPDTQAALRVTDVALPVRELGSAAVRFARRFTARYGHAPDPSAVFGYEAMSTVLAALARVRPGQNRRAAVLRAYFRDSSRRGVLGRYRLVRNGDTDRFEIGAYRVRFGRLELDHVLHP
jgi:branched-chain amino acid transport system substrate-binding protein